MSLQLLISSFPCCHTCCPAYLCTLCSRCKPSHQASVNTGSHQRMICTHCNCIDTHVPTCTSHSQHVRHVHVPTFTPCTCTPCNPHSQHVQQAAESSYRQRMAHRANPRVPNEHSREKTDSRSMQSNFMLQEIGCVTSGPQALGFER